MGVDLHMHIMNNKGIVLEKEIFDGRNSTWFENIAGRGYDEVYDAFPRHYGLPEETPAEISEYQSIAGYYDFYYTTVKEFKEWYEEYNPAVDACWVTTYDKWRIQNKGYIPEDPKHYLDGDDIIADMHFVVYENRYDCSKWLFDYLQNHSFANDDIILYYFDR